MIRNRVGETGPARAVTGRAGSPKTTAERLERGRLLFNEGRYFEAHEAWEEAWLVEGGAGTHPPPGPDPDRGRMSQGGGG